MTPVPEDLSGTLYVADERAISVGVEKKPLVFDRVMSGYYLIHKNDLRDMFLQNRELRAKVKELQGR